MRAFLRPSVTRAKFFAAIALALLSEMTLVAAARQNSAPSQSYATEVGEVRRVLLNPQAIAHLNTDTTLSVATTRERCEIVLSRGEALLEIQHDEVRSVRVMAGNVVVQPDAATFSVRLRDADHVDILVRQGSIALTSTSAAPMRAFKETQLTANHSARVTPSGVSIKDLGDPEVARRLQWTAGVLWFQGETLEEATQEFNRCNIQHLVIEDPGIGELRIGGKFQCTSPERFVEALHALGVRRLERTPSEASGGLIRLVGAR